MRSWLYTPANTPSRMINAPLLGADGVVFDLEDSISEEQKDEARLLLASMLPTILLDTATVRPHVQIAVRINGLDTKHWQDDLEAVVTSGGRLIRIPKVEGPGDIKEVDALLNHLEKEGQIAEGSVGLHALLETPRGIEAAFTIADSSSRLQGLGFGAEDYCAALRIGRATESSVLDYPRTRIANAAAAAAIHAFDAAWGFIEDSEGLKAESQRSRRLGMHGKSAIHPSQIAIINDGFSFSKEEITYAKKIISAMEDSAGVVSLDGRMIDRPVIAWARAVFASIGEREI
ncbi:MAG: CoA ester lyase [Sphaerochaeta sp.]|jgi:citrate lyase subunit beta/citryl-CoA lyase